MSQVNQTLDRVNRIAPPPLTNREDRAVRYIARYLMRHSVAPRYAEIGAAIGLSSKSRVHVLLVALASKGHIRRLPHRRQAIEIMRWPEPRYFRWVRTDAHGGELVAFTPAATVNASEGG